MDLYICFLFNKTNGWSICNVPFRISLTLINSCLDFRPDRWKRRDSILRICKLASIFYFRWEPIDIFIPCRNKNRLFPSGNKRRKSCYLFNVLASGIVGTTFK